MENNQTAPERLVYSNASEVGQALGLSKPTILQLTHRAHDPLPCVRYGQGRRMVFPVRLVQEWLERQTQSEN